MKRWKKEQRENEENLFQFFISTIFSVPWLGGCELKYFHTRACFPPLPLYQTPTAFLSSHWNVVVGGKIHWRCEWMKKSTLMGTVSKSTFNASGKVSREKISADSESLNNWETVTECKGRGWRSCSLIFWACVDWIAVQLPFRLITPYHRLSLRLLAIKNSLHECVTKHPDWVTTPKHLKTPQHPSAFNSSPSTMNLESHIASNCNGFIPTRPKTIPERTA